MERFVIGVDGGGTDTKGILVKTSGIIASTSKVGPTNYQVVGGARLKSEVERMFAQFDIPQNGGEVSEIANMHLCLAGAGRQSDRDEVKALFQNYPFIKSVSVNSDAMAALAGAFGGEPGIILIAGTGSICFGKDDAGQVVRSGGWGYLLGDEGSGFYIGQQAIMAALKDFDGRGEATALRATIEKMFDLPQIDQIIPKIYKQEIDRVGIASLAPVVFKVAREDDAVAEEIIRQTGIEQGKLAKAVAEKLGLLNKKIQVALIGGVFNQKEILANEIAKELYELSWDVEIIEPRFPPAVGAAILALQEIGVEITPQILENLKKSNIVQGSN